jgi:excisionase family DNA binding protein
MDLNEVCDYLRLSRSSVKRAVKAGTIPALKIGTCLRFRRSDILALWDRNK